MPMTRGTIESLLDSPDKRNFVVSAFADLTVKDGFRDLSDQEFRNQARTALAMMAGTEAAEALEASLAAVRSAIREVDPTARGVAVFTSQARGLHHVMPLKTRVENRLVINEEPYVLPLLEIWHGEPSYLVAVIDSDHAHIF